MRSPFRPPSLYTGSRPRECLQRVSKYWRGGSVTAMGGSPPLNAAISAPIASPHSPHHAASSYLIGNSDLSACGLVRAADDSGGLCMLRTGAGAAVTRLPTQTPDLSWPGALGDPHSVPIERAQKQTQGRITSKSQKCTPLQHLVLTLSAVREARVALLSGPGGLLLAQPEGQHGVNRTFSLGETRASKPSRQAPSSAIRDHTSDHAPYFQNKPCGRPPNGPRLGVARFFGNHAPPPRHALLEQRLGRVAGLARVSGDVGPLGSLLRVVLDTRGGVQGTGEAGAKRRRKARGAASKTELHHGTQSYESMI